LKGAVELAGPTRRLAANIVRFEIKNRARVASPRTH